MLLVSAAFGHSAGAQETTVGETAVEAAAAELADIERRAFQTLAGLVGRLRPSVAVPLLTEAGERGSAAALAQLGSMHSSGQGVPQDAGEAMRLMRAAAELGNYMGQVFLGGIYLYGEGVDRDPVQARAWLEAAANQEDPYALFQLAGIYGTGDIADADSALRFELLSRSAELGYRPARRDLGIMLFHDADRRDAAKAVYMLELVADEDAEAARELGYQYLTGQHSERNIVEAAKWISLAAGKGDTAAILLLADMTEKGVGVEPDPLRARQLREPVIAASTPEQKNNLAWRYAVAPEEVLRNGALAVEIMEGLLASADMVTAMRLDTLAAAYAEAGRFDDATVTQEAAIDRLMAAGDPAPSPDPEAWLPDFRSRLDRYRSGLAYRVPY